MISEADIEWPESLQPVVLSANSHKKRSTGYSQFYLMFGREIDHLPLLRYINSKVDSDEEGIDESGESSSWNAELEQNRALIATTLDPISKLSRQIEEII